MKVNYTTPCSKSELYGIRSFVAQHLNDLHLTDVEKNNIVLAIDEACANAIIHGNNCNQKHELQIELEIKPRQLKIEIYDIGNNHPAETSWSPEDMHTHVKKRKKGGLGMVLLHKIMDNVRYYKKNKKNICALTKKLPK